MCQRILTYKSYFVSLTETEAHKFDCIMSLAQNNRKTKEVLVETGAEYANADFEQCWGIIYLVKMKRLMAINYF